MNKLIKFIFVLISSTILSSNLSFADDKVLSRGHFTTPAYSGSGVYLNTYAVLCIDGYKFLSTRSKNGSGLVQMYELKNNKSVPSKC